jgi:hypothetical protein
MSLPGSGFMKTLITAAFVLSATAAQAQDTSALLQQKAQGLADAIAPGQAQVWTDILDSQMLMTDENGVVTDKAGSVKEITPLPKGASGTIKVIDWRANVEKDLAVAAYIYDEFENFHGQHLHAQYRLTTSWVKRGAAWKLLSMQILATRQDPPAVTLPAKLTDEYVGKYVGGPDLIFTITKKDGRLMGQGAAAPTELKAELADVLFVPGQPRSRRIFQRNASGRVTGFVSRREERDLVFKKAG